MSLHDLKHLTADQAKLLADVLEARRCGIDYARRHKTIAMPTVACLSMLSIARADGVVRPGWSWDDWKIERVAATCWDYLAAAIWCAPALVRS